MRNSYTISFWLVVIGGLNWLLVGLFNWDLGVLFGGQGAVISKIIYILVGLAALYLLFYHKDCCSKCKSVCTTEAKSSEPQMEEKPASNFNTEGSPEGEAGMH